MQKITPFLWFDNQAEEAVEFYTSVFSDAAVGEVLRYDENGPGPEGTVRTVSFQLEGTEFTALNGGPHFSFSEAISFVINCESQEEVDYYWEKLSEGGEIQPCGWLTDRFGVSWQIVPVALMEMLKDADSEKVRRVIGVMLTMSRLDIASLEKAYAGP